MPKSSNDEQNRPATREELEARVASLTKKLHELEVRFSQVDRERIEYLQNVAHQLVAPLNAIKWHIENLTNARMSLERSKKVLRSVYSQATIAVHLAKNFALMSTLEADHSLAQLQEPVESVDLYRLLVNLADDFQPLGWDKQVHISVDESLKKAPPVLAIKNLIAQVFSNIIENAVKYSAKETTVRISSELESGAVRVLVRSRGIRLRAEDRARVFDRGFRSPDARNSHPAGTGFGLYIARKIVEIHDGEIMAYTDPQDCTVFEVLLDT